MMTRTARAERRTNLRRLDWLRVETEEKRKELEAKYSAMPTLSAAQCQEAVIRILAMSEEAVVEFLLDYRMRKAGKGPAYYYMPPRDTRYVDDQEMAEAIEHLNVAVCMYDEALLDLRIAELFGGRVSYSRYEPLSKALCTTDALGKLMSVVNKGGCPAFVRLH
jgi:hypothetical protein